MQRNVCFLAAFISFSAVITACQGYKEVRVDQSQGRDGPDSGDSRSAQGSGSADGAVGSMGEVLGRDAAGRSSHPTTEGGATGTQKPGEGSPSPWSWSKIEAAPFSTASIDVDTAAYTRARYAINLGQRPLPAQVRAEDFLNYFPYSYAAPKDDSVASVHQELVPSPWTEGAMVLRVGIKGKEVAEANPPKNLVFLVDVSGSMAHEAKLPMVKASLKALTETLQPADKLSIVTYAGAAEILLPSTPGSEKQKIKLAIERLGAGGGTNGGAGIKQAYEIAQAQFIANGVNRVIMTTDGDFNVGVQSSQELVKLIKDNSESGIFLTILGYGIDSNDELMENVAKDGNGNYFFIDNSREIEKVIGSDLAANVIAVAKDVKIQLEFNPRLVASYRMVGYLNRQLQDSEFNNDTKDAGDLGSGQTVTYLYELQMKPAAEAFLSTYKLGQGVDPLIYQTNGVLSEAAKKDELGTLKIRYKTPDGTLSSKLDHIIKTVASPQASLDMNWQLGVASVALKLSQIPDAKVDIAKVKTLLQGSVGDDPRGLRKEFLDLLEKLSIEP